MATSSEEDKIVGDSALLTLSRFDQGSGVSTVQLQLVRAAPPATASGGHVFETVLPVEAEDISFESPDALISSCVLKTVSKNCFNEQPDHLRELLGCTVTVDDATGTLVGYDATTLLLQHDDDEATTAVGRGGKVRARPTIARPSVGTHVRLGLSFVLPEPPQTWTLVVRYQVPASLLGWRPHYQASVLADNTVHFAALFDIRNRLAASFEGARVVFSTHGSSSPSSDTSSSLVDGRKKSKRLSGGAYTSSLLSKLSKDYPTSYNVYSPDAEYFFQGGVPVTISALQTQQLTYHQHRVAVEPADCWFLFDACSDYPSPGRIVTNEIANKIPLVTTAPQLVVDLANSDENGFGCDLPTGAIQVYTSNGSLLSSYYQQQPMAMFSDAAVFVASQRGERVRIPVHTPALTVKCKKERTAYRATARSLTESFTYEVENAHSATPIDVLVFDCAFRHHEWYIVRQSAPCDRIGIHFFAVPVRRLPFGAKVEVSITIEYVFNLAQAADSDAPQPSAQDAPAASSLSVEPTSHKKLSPRPSGSLFSMFSK